MPNHAYKTLPAPYPSREHPGPTVEAAEACAPLEQQLPPSAAESPAVRLQWELYQRFNAERHPPVPPPFPAPLRIALLAGGGVGAWMAFYTLARAAFAALH